MRLILESGQKQGALQIYICVCTYMCIYIHAHMYIYMFPYVSCFNSVLYLWTGGQCFFDIYVLVVCVCAGSSVSGYDDTSSDNSTADAADPSAASPEPSAASGSSPAATGPHVTAGNVQLAFMS